jgi:hypothetical protein
MQRSKKKRGIRSVICFCRGSFKQVNGCEHTPGCILGSDELSVDTRWSSARP